LRSYVHGDSFTLQEHRDGNLGLRPCYQALLDLIDTSDPAWPATAAALREMAEAGVEITEATFVIAAKLGAHRLAMLDAHYVPSRRVAYEMVPLAATDSIVYYIRRGDVIKIGTTTDPAKRFSALMPDEILAYEPGTRKEELIRHRQFAHLRQRGEHFRGAPELTEHIRHIRELYGDPDPTWPTTARAAPARKTPEASANDLPPLITGETITAAEAYRRFGIKPGTLAAWVRNRRISMAGRNDRGHHLYHAEHLAFLHAKTVARRRQVA
jgi:hypothetical protein